MGSSRRFMRSVAAVLFLAVCAYCGAALGNAIGKALPLTAACMTEVSGRLRLQGIAVRHEQLLPDNNWSICVQDGSRLSAGSVLAKNGQSSLLSDSSAIYMSRADGYEYLSPDMLKNLTARQFNGILKCKPESTAASAGRLVTQNCWCFAALCPEDAALEEGQQCSLRFEGSSQPVQARVMSLSPVEDGQRLLLLRLMAGGSELLSLRFCSAELTGLGQRGIRFPASALCTDEEGNECVNILLDGHSLRRRVDIIYTDPAGLWHLSAADAGDAYLQDGDIVRG